MDSFELLFMSIGCITEWGSLCVCGLVGLGGIFFHKQIQDLRDYGVGLFNGECKACLGAIRSRLTLALPGFTNLNPLTFTPFMTDHTPHLSG